MKKSTLRLKNLGIDSHGKNFIYMRGDCHVCHSEGFEVQSRVKVTLGNSSIIAIVNIINSELLSINEASLSSHAWQALKARENDEITISHAEPNYSLSHIRSKIYGNKFSYKQLEEIIRDISSDRYSEAEISCFLTACASKKMTNREIAYLTQNMVNIGDKLYWNEGYHKKNRRIVVDKHCIGGLPGNRTTPIIVAIVTAFGITMPKTSSRAITSPAGTADSMEVLAPVNLDVAQIRRVVEKEGGCIVWGGAVSLSPVDDALVKVERILDLDSEFQMVASILSKKIAAGSSHVLIDIPVGTTAKIRSLEAANLLKQRLETVGKKLGLNVKVIFTDGSQPVGRGIGPALEARDIIQVLRNDSNAPQDLKQRAIHLAGQVLEFSTEVKIGSGQKLAEEILSSGKAWQKFLAICEAQGGIREIPQARHTHQCLSSRDGVVTKIDTRAIALVAKLAGAPNNKASGVDLHVRLESKIKRGEPIFTIHAESEGELEYSMNHLESYGINNIVTIIS